MKNALTIRSSQKIFTEEEVSGLTGICLEHLQALARSRHLGFLVRAAEAAAQVAGDHADKWFYTDSDLMVVAVLHSRCTH
jgi:hypothetical protein